MSHAAVAWAQQQRTGSASAKAVLVELADHANPDGMCWPSWSRIARRTELSRSSVWRAIDHLVRARLVVLVRTGGGSQKRTNVYRLNMTEPRWPAEVPDEPTGPPGGSGPATETPPSLFDGSRDETGTTVLGSHDATPGVAWRDPNGSRHATARVASRDLTGRVTRHEPVNEPVIEPSDAHLREAFPGSELIVDDITPAVQACDADRKAEAAVKVGALRALLAKSEGGAVS